MRISHGRDLASVAVVFAPAVVFGLVGWSIGWGIVAGGVAALYLNLEKVKSLKYKGLEIELREAIKAAYATTDSVRQIARTLLLAAMYDLNHSGRIVGTDDSERHRMRDELDLLARDLGIHDDVAIQTAREDFYCLHTWDRFQHFAHMFVKEPVVHKRLQALSDRHTTKYPTEADLREACGGIYDALEPEQRVARDEYLCYVRERTAASRS